MQRLFKLRGSSRFAAKAPWSLLAALGARRCFLGGFCMPDRCLLDAFRGRFMLKLLRTNGPKPVTPLNKN